MTDLNHNEKKAFLVKSSSLKDVRTFCREVFEKLNIEQNLKDVQYMDSSGISVIIESNQRAREKNTKVELKEVSQPVEKVLAMARKFL